MTTVVKSSESARLVPGFQAMSDLAYREAGLVLSPNKAALIHSRLRHRLRALGLRTLEDYCDYMNSSDSDAERRHMISALTTNVSGFFREPHHFHQLSKDLVPQMIERLKQGRPVRIWSAGCSNGQEAYSIAMLLLEHDAVFATGNFRLLATDIDPNVIRFAISGVYDSSQISGLSQARLKRFAERAADGSGNPLYRMSPVLRNMIAFKELNLNGPWPMKGRFDAIFCRNVVIYFDLDTQERLWPRFGELLTRDGIVFVGHSERISSPGFRPAGATSYRKSNLGAAPTSTRILNRDC